MVELLPIITYNILLLNFMSSFRLIPLDNCYVWTRGIIIYLLQVSKLQWLTEQLKMLTQSKEQTHSILSKRLSVPEYTSPSFGRSNALHCQVSSKMSSLLLELSVLPGSNRHLLNGHFLYNLRARVKPCAFIYTDYNI